MPSRLFFISHVGDRSTSPEAKRNIWKAQGKHKRDWYEIDPAHRKAELLRPDRILPLSCELDLKDTWILDQLHMCKKLAHKTYLPVLYNIKTEDNCSKCDSSKT